MVEQFIRTLHARDLSHATINKYVSAIAKLDAGLRVLHWRADESPPLVSMDLYSRHADARPEPFSPTEAKQVIDYLKVKCPDHRLASAAEAV